MTRYAGIIKSGELVALRGDPETLQQLAETEMAREIERQRRVISGLETQIQILRARDAMYWREQSRRNHREPRRWGPGWLRRLSDRINVWWTVMWLGEEAVYGEDPAWTR